MKQNEKQKESTDVDTNFTSWIEENEVGNHVVREITYVDVVKEEEVTIKFKIYVLSGLDKEEVESALFEDGTETMSTFAYKKELVRKSLGISSKQIDILYRNKPASAVDALESVCMDVNSSRYTASKTDVEEAKN